MVSPLAKLRAETCWANTCRSSVSSKAKRGTSLKTAGLTIHLFPPLFAAAHRWRTCSFSKHNHTTGGLAAQHGGVGIVDLAERVRLGDQPSEVEPATQVQVGDQAEVARGVGGPIVRAHDRLLLADDQGAWQIDSCAHRRDADEHERTALACRFEALLLDGRDADRLEHVIRAPPAGERTDLLRR